MLIDIPKQEFLDGLETGIKMDIKKYIKTNKDDIGNEVIDDQEKVIEAPVEVVEKKDTGIYDVGIDDEDEYDMNMDDEEDDEDFVAEDDDEEDDEDFVAEDDDEEDEDDFVMNMDEEDDDEEDDEDFVMNMDEEDEDDDDIEEDEDDFVVADEDIVEASIENVVNIESSKGISFVKDENIISKKDNKFVGDINNKIDNKSLCDSHNNNIEDCKNVDDGKHIINNESGVIFNKNMTLVEFLRENPSMNTLDAVQDYFSTDNIKKSIKYGEVYFKRGKLIF